MSIWLLLYTSKYIWVPSKNFHFESGKSRSVIYWSHRQILLNFQTFSKIISKTNLPVGLKSINFESSDATSENLSDHCHCTCQPHKLDLTLMNYLNYLSRPLGSFFYYCCDWWWISINLTIRFGNLTINTNHSGIYDLICHCLHLNIMATIYLDQQIYCIYF